MVMKKFFSSGLPSALEPFCSQSVSIQLRYSRLKTSVFKYFAPKDKKKRRSTSMRNLGFSDHDLWIAATAIQHGLTLVSTDSDFQRINQVQPFSLESWK
ncbi:MAG: type II toxin-antitoxin system VapC family toxin [Symploca sp. SIO1B1]|nr:type II toxin-antitoxin system VapC family toxin [Symploca sp. SIO1C2]NER50323.1 type II toxin-antitoxin system VapC family toxin [Symploca sp. SIO1A3]NER98948.1 type II toxin-antitoxin system VapC family toxin [Symploca sp. SIO1B1]